MSTRISPIFAVPAGLALAAAGFCLGWMLKPASPAVSDPSRPILIERSATAEGRPQDRLKAPVAQNAATNPPSAENAAADLRRQLEEMARILETDPAKALELAARIRSRLAEPMANRAARELVKMDGRRAADLAAALADSVGLNPLEHVANDWPRLDAAAALAWARGYQGIAREGVLLRVFNGALQPPDGGEPDPALARSMAAEMPALLSGGAQEGDWDYAVAQLSQRLLGVLAKADGPGNAMEWVETLPHRGVVDHFRQEAMVRWLAEDAEAASAWVAALPAGPARDFHALSIIQQACEEDPVAAARWAESLSDPKLRAEARERVGVH